MVEERLEVHGCGNLEQEEVSSRTFRCLDGYMPKINALPNQSALITKQKFMEEMIVDRSASDA